MKITPVESIKIDQKVRVKAFLYLYKYFYGDIIQKCLSSTLISGGTVMADFDTWFENLEKDKSQLEREFNIDFSNPKNNKLFSYIRLCINNYATDLGIKPDTNSYWNLYFSSPIHECVKIVQRDCLCSDLMTTKLLLPARVYYGLNKIFANLFEQKDDGYQTHVDKIEDRIMQNIRHDGGECSFNIEGEISVIKSGDMPLSALMVHITYKINDFTKIVKQSIPLDLNHGDFSSYKNGKYGEPFLKSCDQVLRKYLQFSFAPFIFEEFENAGYDTRSKPGYIIIPTEIDDSDDTITI